MQKPQKKALLVQMGRQQELLKRYSHCLNFQIYHTSLFYPNFIKQLRLKGDICLALHQMLEVHPPLNMPYCWLVKVSGEVCVKSDLKLTTHSSHKKQKRESQHIILFETLLCYLCKSAISQILR